MLPRAIWVGFLIVALASLAHSVLAYRRYKRAGLRIPPYAAGAIPLHAGLTLVVAARLIPSPTSAGWLMSASALALLGSAVALMRRAAARAGDHGF